MLQIRTTAAKLGINNYKPVQSIEQPKGEQSIRQPKVELKIDSELPKVIIDQYQCFAEAGLKSPSDLARDNSQWSYQKVMEGIARRNQEGDMLAHIENKTDPIPDIFEKNAYPTYDFNIDFIPKSRPKIDVTGSLNIDWQITKPEINYKPNKPIINYQPGKVGIYIREWNSIEIKYIDEKV